MPSRPFLTPDLADPYGYYAERLQESPIEWDPALGCWTIASYEACIAILSDPAAEIPALRAEGQQRLNAAALRLTRGLVRLSNPPRHEMLRRLAHQLFEMIRQVPIPELMDGLIGEVPAGNGLTIDWVDRVCKKLPVLAILGGFGLEAGDSEFLLANIDTLVMLMTPDKTDEQAAAINAIAGDLAALSERAVRGMAFPEEMREMAIANLLGLIIQSYDAGRGLLSNSLLQLLADPETKTDQDTGYFQRSVIETLRWDPPVHHTRRTAGQDLVVGGQLIRKGQSIIVMLAAANRDPRKFAEPDRCDIRRSNNSEQLSFGAGHHQCLAAHFSIRMASAAMAHLFGRYGQVTLADGKQVYGNQVYGNRMYEPRWNCRLLREMRIHLPGALL